MAKKEKLELDDFDLDDMVFDDGFGDVDDQINPEVKKSKKREAITNVFNGTISGVTGKLADPSFLAQMTKASLPESYGTIFNAADQIAGTASSIAEDAIREIRPQASRIAKKIDKLVPAEQKSLKKLTGKISNFFGDETKLPDVSKQQQQDQGIQSSLGAIFGATQEANQAAEARGNAENRVRDSVDNRRFKSNFGLLNQINQNTGIVAQYTQKITQAYQKKSLELQYKSFFTQSELLQTTNKFFEIFKNQGEAITKNTALPEFVKINTSEMFKQQSYNKFISGAQDSLFGKESALGKGLARLKKDAGQYVGGIKQGLETALSALDGVESLQEQNRMLVEMGAEPMSGSKVAGIALGGGIADKAGAAASKALRKITGNNKTIRDVGNRGANIVSNLPGSVKTLRDNQRYTDARDGGGVRGKLVGAFDGLLNYLTEQDPDMKIKNQAGSIKSQQLGSVFDVKTQRSIVDVIPGYLSRILREITVLRTGDESIGRILYDQTNGNFSDKAGISKSINKVLKSKSKSTMLDYRLESLAKSNVGGSEQAAHTPEQKGKLKEFYAKLATIPNMDFTPDNIMKTQLYQSLDADTAKHIKDTFDSTITNSDDKHANQRTLTESLMAVKQVTPDMRGEIEEFIKAGYGEILIEQGLITRNENNDYDINPEAYHKFVSDNAIVKSDKNAKTNIKLAPKKGILDGNAKSGKLGKIGGKNPIDAKKAKRHLVKSDVTTKENITYMQPKAALKAIAGTEVYNWNYKNGQGDQQPHTGPMAQDVRRKMGEDAAPGGKSLDLTTMNGNNMSAIQALKEEQDKLSRGDTSAAILKEIKSDTESMLKFMQEHPGSGGGGGNGAGGPTPAVGDDYKSLMTNILSSTASVVGKMGGDLFSGGKSAFNFTKDKIAKPGAKKAGELYDNHKDSVADAFKRLFKKSGEIAGKALDTANDVMFNKLPAGIKQAAILGGKVKDYVKNLINQTRDVYLKNSSKPILRATLLKAGYYKDAVTGKAIKTLDDLAELKGNIVGPTGEIIMTIEEAAEGLVDQTGAVIKTTFHKVMEFGADKLKKGFENAKKFWKSASLLGKKGLDKGKDLAGKGKDKLKDMDPLGGIGLGGGKIYDVLVEIRDLMRGENPERHEDKAKNKAKHKEEFVGPMPEGVVSKAKGKVGSLKDQAKEKLNKLKDDAKAKLAERREDFVGPMPESETSQLKDKLKNLKEQTKEKLGNIKKQAKSKADELKAHRANFVGPFPEGIVSKTKGKAKRAKKAVADKVASLTPEKSELGVIRREPQMAPEKEEHEVAKIDLDPKYRSATNVLDDLGGKFSAVKGMAQNALGAVGGIEGIKGKGLAAVGAMSGARGIKGKGLAAIGSLFNKGQKVDLTKPKPTDQKVDLTKNQAVGLENDEPVKKLKGNKRQQKKKAKLLGIAASPEFKDPVAMGNRKGNWQDRIADLEKRKRDRNAIPKAAVDLKAKYRSDENVIDTMMAKASGIFGMAKTGLGSIFGGAGTMLDTASSLIGLKGGGGILGKLGGIGKGALGLVKSPIKTLGSIGRPLVAGVSKLKNVGSIARMASLAGTVRNMALVGSLMTGGIGGAVMGAVGAGLSAIGAALASPVVLGALAVGAVAYGGYKLFKYVTRDNANEYDDIRLKQYGLYGETTKKYNHLVFKLEDYLSDDKVGYDRGKAYIIEKKINKEELISIFDIDKDDVTACATFSKWYSQRFLPFFLTHLTALFSINNKLKLSEITKLKVPDRIKYLNLVGFEGGPYQVDSNPFQGLESLNVDKTISLNTIKVLIEKLNEADKKNSKAPVAPLVPPVAKIPPKIITPIKDKPPETLPKSKDKLDDLKESGEGDGPLKDDKKETGDGPKGSVEGSNPASFGKVKEATGPMRNGEGASQYMRVPNNVSLSGINPSLLKNFKAMVQEYGETTGKSITVTSGSRSSEQQAALYRKNPAKAAKPGRSLHEFGLAMDANSADLTAMDNAGLMRKYGFTRPVGGEPWHIEPAGIQPQIQNAKDNPSFATQAVEASLFKGGGGAGATPGTPLGKRNPALALSLLNQSASEVVKEQPKTDKDKVTDALAINKPPETKTGTPSPTPPMASSGEAMPQVTVKAKRMTDAEKVAFDTEAESKPAVSSVKSQVGQSEKYSKNSDLPKPPDVTSAADDSTSGGASKGPIDINNKNQVKQVVEEIAKQQNVDPKKMSAFAAVESGLNPSAKAKGSSATGLFQFTRGTWNEQMAVNGRKFNLDPNAQPTDLRASTLLATGFVKANEKIISKVKSQPNMTDAYMAHFLGPYGAKKFLSANPNAIAADVMPSAAKSNPNIFYDKGRPLTVGEVYKKMDTKLGSVAKQFGITMGSNSLAGSSKAANDGPGTAPPAILSDKPQASAAPVAPVAPPRSLSGGAPVASGSADTMTSSVPSSVPPRAKGFLTGQPATLISPAMDDQQNRGMSTGMDVTGTMNTTMTKQLEVQEKILSAITDLTKTMTGMSKASPVESTKEKDPKVAGSASTSRNQVANTAASIVKSAIDLRRRLA